MDCKNLVRRIENSASIKSNEGTMYLIMGPRFRAETSRFNAMAPMCQESTNPLQSKSLDRFTLM